jgi:restriction endonuclease Mrr
VLAVGGSTIGRDEADGPVQSEEQAAVELTSATPEETIQSAEDTISATLRTELLNRISELSPAFFERLVVDLIVAMGYGGTRRSVVQALGKSGDEGIDGVVSSHIIAQCGSAYTLC